ncbi:MAG TPA: hypothetical protein VL947_04245, partial [Cytophagales bacterium]|nr:hypothetical protein [Cytophagales bacterium]
FLTHNYYWQDYYGIPPLSFIPSNNIVLTNIMTGQRNTTAELKELYAKEGEGQISLDRQKGRIQSIQLRIKVPNKQMETYNIPWQDYTHAMTDSNHTRKAKALKLVDAWLTKLFVYDESIKLIYGGDTDEMQNEKTISRGGYFKGTHKKDPLCRSNITSSFTSTKPAVEKLSVSLLEEVSLGDTNNQLLFSGKWPLQSLVREYVLAGKLKSIRAYDTTAKEYLSLANAEKSKNYYAISDLKRQLTQDYPAYNIKDKYRKGDIVLFEGRHYKALQNPGDREPADSSALLLKVWEKVQPQQYDPKQLYLLQTHLNCHFDTTGKLTAHQLEYVELILPESENLKGVDKPLLVVNWDALRNLLIADPRAKVKKGAKVVNYADILEQRAYKAWILKTGFLKGGE